MSGNMKRTTSLTILAGAFIALFAFAYLPFHSAWSIEEDIAQKGELSKRLVTVYRARSGRGDGRGDGISAAAQSQLLLSGRTNAIAGAFLQKRLNDLIIKSGGTPVQFQQVDPEAEGKFSRIGVTASLKVGSAGLRKIVHEIESGSPLLFVEGLTMTPSNRSVQMDDPYFRGSLDVRLTVVGYKRTGVGS